MFEVFLVSIIYWIALLIIFIWFNKRLSSLKERIAGLDKEVKER